MPAFLNKSSVRIRMKPALRCKFFYIKTSAVCSVACLEWQRWIADHTSHASANVLRLLPLETVSAKEAKNRQLLQRKTPRPVKAYAGLQCALSGNQVMFLETKHRSV